MLHSPPPLSPSLSLHGRTLETGKSQFSRRSQEKKEGEEGREQERERERENKQTVTQEVVQTPWPALRHLLFQCMKSLSLPPRNT